MFHDYLHCCCICDVVLCFFVVFFFKQKTAYEMRISDWSSDVCSSDLDRGEQVGRPHLAVLLAWQQFGLGQPEDVGGGVDQPVVEELFDLLQAQPLDIHRAAAAEMAQPLDALRGADQPAGAADRSETHTSDLQSLMRSSYAVFCLKKTRS